MSNITEENDYCQQVTGRALDDRPKWLVVY